MRKFFLLIVFALSFVLPCFAEEAPSVYACGDFQYILLQDGTVEIVKYSGTTKQLTVPEMLNECRVSSIGNYAFQYSKLASITIPDSITTMGKNPLIGCLNLTDIRVSPDHPVFAVIDGVLFSKAEKKLICYPLSKTETKYIVPQGITEIGSSAFYGGNDLTSIILPDGLAIIGDHAFSSCSSLLSIFLPDSLTVMGTAPFGGCRGLKSIRTSPDNPIFATIDGVLFSKADKKLIKYPTARSGQEYAVPQGITEIGDDAFAFCKLTNIILPDSIVTIGNYAFTYCPYLTSITLPDGIISLGERAFAFGSLTSINLPNSLTSIGTLIYDCGDLNDIRVSPDHPVFAVSDSVVFSKPERKLIGYPRTKPEESYSVPEGIMEIGDRAFTSCCNLTSITLPDSVTIIGDYAFGFCSELTSVILPENLVSIGDHAFFSCSNLTSITLPDSLVSIADEAFSGCDNLTSIIVSRDSYAAQYCKQHGLPYTYPGANDWLNH